MRLVSIADVKPGQLVAHPVMDDVGRILLQKGVVLTTEYIASLRRKGFTRLYVSDPGKAESVPIEEDVSPEIRAKAAQTLEKTYKAIGGEVHRLRELSSVDIYESLSSEPVRALMVKNGPMTRIHELVREILDEVLSHDLLAGLTSIKSASGDIYQHSIDVCAISIVVGRTVGLDKKRLRQLATGALLHDVGSIFLESHGRDAAYIVQHTKLGYELLRNNDDPDILAPHVAYEHHEHQDGTGLPRGLRGDNMIERHHGTSQTVPTLIGEIAAIANAYDNLLSGRDGGEPMTPDLALQHIRENAGSTFNRAIVAAFLRVTPVFPKGTEVIIRAGTHKGYTAIVAEVHPGALDRPIITLTHDAHNHPIEPRLIDLLDTPNTDIRAKGI